MAETVYRSLQAVCFVSMNTEELRAKYRPLQIRVLLIGESPPVGGTFFYKANSNLYRYTRAAFERALDRQWRSDDAFLEFLREYGFFLDDLCLEPVNGTPSTERRKARVAGEASLADRLMKMQPEYIGVTPKAIARNVARSLAAAGLDNTATALPFPAMSWQRAYVKELDAFLRSVPPASRS